MAGGGRAWDFEFGFDTGVLGLALLAYCLDSGKMWGWSVLL